MSPFNKLPVKKQKYVKAIANGKSKQEAKAIAGYSQNNYSIDTPDVRAAFAELVRQRIRPERIIRKLKEGMEAKETQFFSKDGLVIDHRDTVAWGERRRYTELAAQYGGYYTPKQEVDVTQRMDEGTARRLADIADKLGIVDMEFEERRELRKSYVVLNANNESEDSDSQENT